MEALTPRDLVIRSAALGLGIGSAVFSFYVCRTLYAISCGGRWHHAHQLGIGVMPSLRKRK